MSKHARKPELRPCSTTVLILEMTIDLGGVCVSQSGKPGGYIYKMLERIANCFKLNSSQLQEKKRGEWAAYSQLDCQPFSFCERIGSHSSLVQVS